MKSLKLVIPIAVMTMLFLVVFQFQSCKHEPVGLDLLDTVCFETQVLPIFTASCGKTGCHNASSREAGFDATSYASIVKHVVPGNAWKSELYKIVTSPNNPNMMPPSPDKPLSKEQRTLIEIWIEQGAKNTCPGTTPIGGGGVIKNDTVCFTQDILPIIVSSCGVSGCHDATSHKEGYTLTSYATLMSHQGGIVRGNASQSKLYKVLLPGADERMPQSPYNYLSSTQIALFQKWIQEGALENDCAALKCDTTGTISFNNKIKPLLTSNCLACHGTNYASAGGGVSLVDYNAVKQVSETVKLNKSLLVGAIRHELGFSAMPLPSGSLSICDIRAIELWIDQGKLNN